MIPAEVTLGVCATVRRLIARVRGVWADINSDPYRR